MLSLPRAWVLFLVRELRSCKLCGVAKKKRRFLPFKFNADHTKLDSYKRKVDLWWLQCSYLYALVPFRNGLKNTELSLQGSWNVLLFPWNRYWKILKDIFVPNFFFWILLWILFQQKVEHLKLERDVVSFLYTKKQIKRK